MEIRKLKIGDHFENKNGERIVVSNIFKSGNRYLIETKSANGPSVEFPKLSTIDMFRRFVMSQYPIFLGKHWQEKDERGRCIDKFEYEREKK